MRQKQKQKGNASGKDTSNSYTGDTETRVGGLEPQENTLETVLSALSAAGNDRLKCLKKVPFLQQVSDTTLDVMKGLLICRTVPGGRNVFKQGDLGRSMYILMKGKCEVHRDDGYGNFIHLAYLNPSDYFGEIALMVNVPRTATVTAVTTCILLELPLENLKRFLEVVPDCRRVFMPIVKQRVTRVFKKLKIPFFMAIPRDK